MSHFRSSSQPGELGKRVQRVDEDEQAAGMSKKRADPPDKKGKQDKSYTPGVPSTRNIGQKAWAERWSKDIGKEAEEGKQLKLGFKAPRLVLEKRVCNCANILHFPCIFLHFGM